MTISTLASAQDDQNLASFILRNHEASALPTVGNSNAEITVVEFFDYRCGYCAKQAKDFEKILKISNFSEKDIKFKKDELDKFIENGFPSKKLENWKFLDLSQIINKNIDNISFYNDYSTTNKIDTSIYIDGLEHNKIIFI